jgi:hypothetical protein
MQRLVAFTEAGRTRRPAAEAVEFGGAIRCCQFTWWTSHVMDACVLCRSMPPDAPLRATIWTGRLAGSDIVGAQQVAPGRVFYSIAQSYTEVEDHAVVFCGRCWRLNERFFRALLWLCGIAVVPALVALIVMIAIGNDGLAGRWTSAVVLMFVPAVVFFVTVPVLFLMSPARRALRKVVLSRDASPTAPEGGCSAFKAHWPSKPFQGQAKRQNDTWD